MSFLEHLLAYTPHRLPRALLVEHHTHRRLALIERMRDRFAIEGVPVGLDPLRTIRARQPELVIIVVYPLRPNRAWDVCRWLKTDVRPIRAVGVVNFYGPARSQDRALEADRADGYYEGPEDLDAVRAFTVAVWEGRRPVDIRPRPGRFWKGIFGR